MTKAYLIILVSLAICILSSLNFAYGAASDQNKFTVLGLVYCDTCRVEFQTSISEPISGATVKLECKNRTTEKITFQSPEITTDKTGSYKIEVTGDYEDSDCDVNLVKSPRADCNDPTEAWRKARVELTALDGVTGQFRFANNLGFKKKEALPGCKKFLQTWVIMNLRMNLEAKPCDIFVLTCSRVIRNE